MSGILPQAELATAFAKRAKTEHRLLRRLRRGQLFVVTSFILVFKSNYLFLFIIVFIGACNKLQKKWLFCCAQIPPEMPLFMHLFQNLFAQMLIHCSVFYYLYVNCTNYNDQVYKLTHLI